MKSMKVIDIHDGTHFVCICYYTDGSPVKMQYKIYKCTDHYHRRLIVTRHDLVSALAILTEIYRYGVDTYRPGEISAWIATGGTYQP